VVCECECRRVVELPYEGPVAAELGTAVWWAVVVSIGGWFAGVWWGLLPVLAALLVCVLWRSALPLRRHRLVVGLYVLSAGLGVGVVGRLYMLEPVLPL
jgi:hypothetical protein